MEEIKPTINFEQFEKLDLRIAKVVEVSDHPNADKLLVLKVDMGGEQRQLVAGLKTHCSAESLLGANIVIVANLQPRKMRGLESQGMLLAAVWGEGDEQKVVILTTQSDVPTGSTVS